jgi:hypothetical protein
MSAITNLSNVIYGVIQANNGIITVLNVGTISPLDEATFLTITGDVQAQGNIISTFTSNMTGNVVGNVTGNITGNLTGSVTGNVNGNLFGSVTGNLEGDVTSTGISTFKVLTAQSLNGSLNEDVTSNLTGDVIGDVTGNLTGNITGDVTNTSTNFTGSFEGQITGTQSVIVIALNTITDANISTTVAIEDTKLGVIQTTSKVVNSATTAVTTATTNTITLQDISGNITANILESTLVNTSQLITNIATQSGGLLHHFLKNGGTIRFALELIGSETGSNNGFNFRIFCYNDNGTFLLNLIMINKTTGATTMTIANANTLNAIAINAASGSFTAGTTT